MEEILNKICPECGAVVLTKNNRFCNSSCFAKFNNKSRAGYKSKFYPSCRLCGLKLKRHNTVCCIACSTKNEYLISNISLQKILSTPADEAPPVVESVLKQFLIIKNKNRCEICDTEEWTGCPVPLVLDHIDGDPSNNKITNRRLICANCDSQLPTFKSRNLGRGRSARRLKIF